MLSPSEFEPAVCAFANETATIKNSTITHLKRFMVVIVQLEPEIELEQNFSALAMVDSEHGVKPLNTLKPIAFLGADAAPVVTALYKLEAHFLPTLVPAHAKLERVVQGLEPLGFLGAVFIGVPNTEALGVMDSLSSSAERDGAVDTIGVMRGTQGSHLLEDGLLAALDAVQYRGFGANAVVIGGGAAASAAVQVARAGLKSLTIAAPDRPHAEKLARNAPAGVVTRTMTWEEPDFLEAIERADLILICEPKVRLDPRLLQPYHTLAEVVSETSLSVALERIGGQTIPFRKIRAQHLAAQLEFVTGRKFRLEGLL